MNVLEGTRSVWKLPEEGWTCVEHSGRWSLEGWLGLLPTLYKEGAFHCWGRNHSTSQAFTNNLLVYQSTTCSVYVS
jgi:hypothetical protein